MHFDDTDNGECSILEVECRGDERVRNEVAIHGMAALDVGNGDSTGEVTGAGYKIAGSCEQCVGRVGRAGEWGSSAGFFGHIMPATLQFPATLGLAVSC